MKPDNFTHIYGKHVVDSVLERRPDIVQVIFISPNFSDARLLAKIQRAKVAIKPLDVRRLPDRLPRDTNHQGVMARISTKDLITPYASYMKSAALSSQTLFLILSEIQDPHNVGAIIRSAAAFGVQAVLMPQRNQAPLTGAVAKVSAGMLFALPMVEMKNTNTAIADLQARGVSVYGLASEGSTSIYDVPFTQASAIVVGNEAEGLRQKTRETCSDLVHIPIHPQCESLNAAASVTASLAVWRGYQQ